MRGRLNQRNRTQRRLDHVKKVYRSVPGVIGGVVATIGNSSIGPLGGPQDSERRQELDAFFTYDSIYDLGPRVNKHIVWLAREFRRALKVHDAHQAAHPHPRRFPDYPHPRSFPRDWPAIRDWLAAHPQDTGHLTWVNARTAAEHWHGTVLTQLGDGWTLHDLQTIDELEYESKAMGHCVRTYASAVRAGESQISSVRDPRGRPHVTIELTRSDSGVFDAIEQVEGKGNTPPKEKYHRYVFAALQFLVPPPLETWPVKYQLYQPGRLDELWDAAIAGEEDIFWDLGEVVPGMDEVTELLDGHKGDWVEGSRARFHQTQIFEPLHASIEDSVLTLEVTASNEHFDDMQQAAQDNYHELAWQLYSKTPGFSDELVWQAWEKGTQEAWFSLSEQIDAHADHSGFDDDGDLVVRFRWPMGDRKTISRDFEQPPYDRVNNTRRMSEAESRVYGGTRAINEAFSSWGDDMVSKASDVLRDLVEDLDVEEDDS